MKRSQVLLFIVTLIVGLIVGKFAFASSKSDEWQNFADNSVAAVTAHQNYLKLALQGEQRYSTEYFRVCVALENASEVADQGLISSFDLDDPKIKYQELCNEQVINDLQIRDEQNLIAQALSASEEMNVLLESLDRDKFNIVNLED